jgi:hypothetical protein
MFSGCYGKMRTLLTGMSTALLMVTTLGMLMGVPLRAAAKPAYAQKEGKACQYCHTSASPGLITVDPVTKERKVEPFNRNARGIYYADHNHSFEGYVERKVMGASAPPVFHFGWRETLSDSARRVAVADVVGDGRPRLITLSEKANNKSTSVLAVKRWDGKAFVTEFTAETQGPADRLEVGKFAGADRPAVILTSDALWFWSGKVYTHVPAARPLPLFGIARMHDGTERVLVANSPTDIKAYTVDMKPGSGDWLTNGIPAPSSSQVTWADMHASTEFFDKIHVPTVLSQGGVIGVWDVRKFGKTFLYHALLNQDYDVKNDASGNNKPEFVLKSQTWCVEFVDPSDTSQSNAKRNGPVGLYFTPSLPSAIYDIATESAKGDGAPGLLILSGDAGDGKGRSLYFYPLD